MCGTYRWLHWVCHVPQVIKTFFQGFLSTVLLLALIKMVPILLRIMARWEGIPQKTSVELSLMDRFFLFQIVVRASYALLDESLTKVCRSAI